MSWWLLCTVSIPSCHVAAIPTSPLTRYNSPGLCLWPHHVGSNLRSLWKATLHITGHRRIDPVQYWDRCQQKCHSHLPDSLFRWRFRLGAHFKCHRCPRRYLCTWAERYSCCLLCRHGRRWPCKSSLWYDLSSGSDLVHVRPFPG
jgi:hypothetical protein